MDGGINERDLRQNGHGARCYSDDELMIKDDGHEDNDDASGS